MIKTIRLPLIALLCFFAFAADAQKSAPADSVKNTYATKKAKTVFFELFGPGVLYSVNYDFRFKNRQDGWGARVGIGYDATERDHIFTIPLAVNYLAGKKGKYFEVGAGLTYYNAATNDFFFDEHFNYTTDANGTIISSSRKSASGVLGSLNFGYRYQPLDGGFSFRTGFSPLITSNQFAFYWPYISFGYAF